MSVSLLSVVNMSKSFGVTKALTEVSIDLNRGEILGLIGENGSGKSTLSSIIAAIGQADSGEMYLEGQPYQPSTSVDANHKGICMILQEKGTFDHLSVAKNIYIGKEELFVSKGFLSTKRMNEAAQVILNSISAEHIDASVPLATLNFEDRKLVEVARAIQSDPKIMIVDETTTALSFNGRKILYGIMEKMKSQGKSVIFISHDLDEIIDVCDKVTILRDGIYIESIEREAYDPNLLRKLMVGREISSHYYRNDNQSCKSKDVVLEAKGLTYKELKDINFKLHKGEILGFGGLGDCGMHILGNLAFGLSTPDLGYIKSSNGQQIKNSTMAMKNKIAYISKNRDQETLMLSSSIVDNVCIASYDKIRKGFFIWPKDEQRFVDQWGKGLDIKMRDTNQYVMELSGGNKQKVALAKWLGFDAQIFILDCPTRGIDIGVKANIYELMRDLKAAGKSIIMISEELAEIIGMCDRIIILKEGLISGEFYREEEPTETKLIEYMV